LTLVKIMPIDLGQHKDDQTNSVVNEY